ncbi:hypothetical protein PR048_026470, partial [Dryococelus australis]
MKDNNTSSWVSVLRIVRSSKNCSYHSGIKRTPYEALFGVPQKNEFLDSCLPLDIVGNIDTEEQLEEYLLNLTQNFDETDTKNVDEANTCEINNQQISSPMESEESVIVCIVFDQQLKKKYPPSNMLNTFLGHALRHHSPKFRYVIFVQRNRLLRPLANTADVDYRNKLRRCFRLLGRISIPDVDRGRLAPRNVLAVIMEEVEPKLFSIGTKLEKLYSNEFQLAPDKSLEISDVPDRNVTVRQEAT